MVDQATRKARTRAAILAAARELFRARGYDGTSIRDVAEAAGVGVGSVHVHFADKEGLLLACFVAQIEEAVALGIDTLPAEASLLDSLCHLVRVLYAAYARHPALSRVMLRAMLFPDGEPPPGDLAVRAELAHAVLGLFSAARERGEIDARPDDGELAFQAFFSFYATALFAGLGGTLGQDDAPEPWVAAFRRLMGQHLKGLSVKPEEER